jgi:predicted deacylase
MNPDGAARRNRYNVRGVDLNRNFPGTWARQYRTGRGPGSEPETRAMMRFIRKLQPTGVLSFHQPWDTTLSVCDTRSAYWVRLAARLMKLNAPGRPSNCGNWLPGTMNRWTARNTPAWFVTVELPPNYKVRRYLPRAATAVVTIAEQMASEDSGFVSP